MCSSKVAINGMARLDRGLHAPTTTARPCSWPSLSQTSVIQIASSVGRIARHDVAHGSPGISPSASEQDPQQLFALAGDGSHLAYQSIHSAFSVRWARDRTHGRRNDSRGDLRVRRRRVQEHLVGLHREHRDLAGARGYAAAGKADHVLAHEIRRRGDRAMLVVVAGPWVFETPARDALVDHGLVAGRRSCRPR